MKAFERIKTMTINEKALELHEKWNGKLDTVSKVQVKTREDLALAYTPGVAEPCKVIAKDPEAAYRYTIKSNTVAVVSDGSAVLGLGNIGPLAAMPVIFLCTLANFLFLTSFCKNTLLLFHYNHIHH